ncbi:MAG TPA: YbaB/EbfC family nucleoid-associated protein [Jiangellaceae bacterium]|nr:YbaB/EbfC family nucleoid-associated protein [Jiangellaceae bacterium]
MFPPGPEGLDVQQLLQQAQRMQEQLMSAQQNLAETEITGTAGGGLVTATVTGAGELVSLDIAPSVVDPTDVETLCDLVVAAVRDAHAQAQRLAADQMGPLGQGLGGLLGGEAGATENHERPPEPGPSPSLGRPPVPGA